MLYRLFDNCRVVRHDRSICTSTWTCTMAFPNWWLSPKQIQQLLIWTSSVPIHVLVIVQSLPERFWYHAWMGRLPALIESVFFTLLGRLDLWLGDALSKFILLLSISWSHYHTMISHTARLHKTETTSICFAHVILLLRCDDYKLHEYTVTCTFLFTWSWILRLYAGHFMVHILKNYFIWSLTRMNFRLHLVFKEKAKLWTIILSYSIMCKTMNKKLFHLTPTL